MPRDTRSCKRGDRSSPRPSRRQTRGGRNSHCTTDPVAETPQKYVPSFPSCEPSHTTAVFAPVTSPPRATQGQHGALTDLTRPQNAPAPPEVPKQHVKDPGNGASPAVALREILQSSNTQEVLHREIEKGNISVIHYKLENHRPSTPGSKSRPIKVEDSPQSCSPSFAQAERLSIKKKRSKAFPTTPIRKQDKTGKRRKSVRTIETRDPDKGVQMVLPAELEFSAAVTSIIASPKAATLFLSCFVAAEEQWLQSSDDDMGPDTAFWQQLVSRFNGDGDGDGDDAGGSLGYSINTWLTARVIATALCSQDYGALVKREQLANDEEEEDDDDGNNTFAKLLAAISECRRISQRRRRRKHWGSPENDEHHVRDETERASEVASEAPLHSEDVVGTPEGNVRLKPLTTLEEYDKFMSDLAENCRASAQAGNRIEIGNERNDTRTAGKAGEAEGRHTRNTKAAFEKQHEVALMQEETCPEPEPASTLPLPPSHQADAAMLDTATPRVENQKPNRLNKRKRRSNQQEGREPYGHKNHTWNPPSAPRNMRQRRGREEGRGRGAERGVERERGQRGERGGRRDHNTSFPSSSSSQYINTTHQHPPPPTTHPYSYRRYSDPYQHQQSQTQDSSPYPYHKKSRLHDLHQHQKRQPRDMDLYEQRFRELERRLDNISRSHHGRGGDHRGRFLDRR